MANASFPWAVVAADVVTTAVLGNRNRDLTGRTVPGGVSGLNGDRISSRGAGRILGGSQVGGEVSGNLDITGKAGLTAGDGDDLRNW